jgi:hypothetical protein
MSSVGKSGSYESCEKYTVVRILRLENINIFYGIISTFYIPTALYCKKCCQSWQDFQKPLFYSGVEIITSYCKMFCSILQIFFSSC